MATTAQEWIVIPNWDRFQHYRDRNPTWIKLHVRLLHESAFLALPIGARCLLVSLWMLYSCTNGEVPTDTRYLSRQLNMTVRMPQLERLKDAGFITFTASKPLANRYQDASETLASRAPAHSQEAETETEKSSSLLRAVTREAADEPARKSRNGTIGNLDTDSMAHALRLIHDIRDHHKDAQTAQVITSYANKLPAAAFETIREKLLEGRATILNDAKYAVAELGRMVKEGQYP